jgi:hypothetical protein
MKIHFRKKKTRWKHAHPLEDKISIIVSKEIKAEIGEIIFLSYFLAKRIKSQRGRN